MTPAQKSHTVVLSGEDKYVLLAEAVGAAGLWTALEAACQHSFLDRDSLRIIIKPDLSQCAHRGLTGTDPELVEALIDLLQERGYSRVAVGSGRDASYHWLENRNPLVIAELTGYRFQTSGGYDYDVFDLDEDREDVPLYEVGVGPLSLGLPWIEADFRISFAKNRSDEQYTYALGLHNLLHVLPLESNPAACAAHLDCGAMAVRLLQKTPVHFAIIDAYTSAHGSAGRSAPRALETRTIIAGTHLVVVDWIGAQKQGVNPLSNPITAAAVRAGFGPNSVCVEGDLLPYTGWKSPGVLVTDSVQKRNGSALIVRICSAWVQSVDRELFPFKSPLDDRINAVLAPIQSRIDDDRTAASIMIVFSYWMAVIRQSVEAVETLYRKERLPRLNRPLNVDPASFPSDDYESIIAYMQPIENLLHEGGLPTNGLKWQYLDGSVVFEYARVIGINYDDFAARIDISQAIRFMNDYIGGSFTPTRFDDSGRVIHQVERNLYLPQPNYLVLYGGKMIDVTKIEVVRYETDRQRMYWRTVKSENGSAQYDDGVVTFRRVDEENTEIIIAGRQQFTLPLFWQIVNLDMYPAVKDPLVTHAYETFFSGTIANFEAAYDGRDIRIGFDPSSSSVSDRIADPYGAIVQVVGDVVTRLGQSLNIDIPGLVGQLTQAVSGGARSQSGPARDDLGFVHVPGQGTPVTPVGSVGLSAQGFLRSSITADSVNSARAATTKLLHELGEALQKDMGISPNE